MVTNVPGPDVPLYVLGARMLEAFPIVPIAGNLSVGVACLTYDDQLTVGLLADPDACPDLEPLADHIRRSFAELVAATSQSPASEAGGPDDAGVTTGPRIDGGLST